MDLVNLDQSFMQKAEELKANCEAVDGTPHTALLVKDDSVVSAGKTCRHSTQDPIRFAEMDCIAQAGRRNDHATLTLYTTNSPNWLVAGTVVQFGIGTVVLGGDENTSPVQFLKDKGVKVRRLGLHHE